MNEHGKPVTSYDHNVSFVTADLAAKLAGVPLNSARRVLEALDRIDRTFGLPRDELLDSSRMPEALPDEERSVNTNRAADIVTRGSFAPRWRQQSGKVGPNVTS